MAGGETRWMVMNRFPRDHLAHPPLYTPALFPSSIRPKTPLAQRQHPSTRSGPMGRPWRPDAPQVQQRTPPAGELLAELLDAAFGIKIQNWAVGKPCSQLEKYFPSHELTAAPAESAASFVRTARRGWLHYRAATARQRLQAAATAAGSSRQ